MIEQVAMEHPVPGFIGFELDGVAAHGRDVHGMLQRGACPVLVDQAEEESVQVDRVVHHGVVNQLHAQDIALFDRDHTLLGHGPAIEGPDIALHVAGQVEGDFGDGAAFGQRGGHGGFQQRIGRGRTGGLHRSALIQSGFHHVIHAIEIGPRGTGGRHVRALPDKSRGVSGAVMGGGPDLRPAAGRKGDEGIVSLANGHEEAVYFNRFHGVAVGGNQRERTGGGLDIKVGGGRTIHEAQKDTVAGIPRQGGGALAIDEKGVVGHIGQVHGLHTGAFAAKKVPDGPSFPSAEERLGSALFQGIPFAATGETAQDFMRVFIGPIGEHQHVLAAGPAGGRRRGFRLNDDGPVKALLLLQMGVGMIPAGAGLDDGKLEGVEGAGLNGRGGDFRHPVLGIRQQHAVPMGGRGVMSKIVMDADAGPVPLRETQHGTGNSAVDGETCHCFSGRSDRGFSNPEVVLHYFGGGRKQTGQEQDGKDDSFHGGGAG